MCIRDRIHIIRYIRCVSLFVNRQFITVCSVIQFDIYIRVIIVCIAKLKAIAILNPDCPICSIEMCIRDRYTITVTDPATSAVSGIDRIEVEVTCEGNPVAGDAAQHTNTYTLDSTTLNQLKGIGDENGDSDGYSVNDLEEKAQYEIQGTILKDSCNSNDVKITVTAYDQAGNPAGETQERELVIDKTAPQITSIVYDSTEKDNCYQERTMTITYQERNFDPTLAKFEIVENENDKDAVTKSCLLYTSRCV